MAFFVNIVPQIPREVTIQPLYDQSAELTEVVAQWMEVVSRSLFSIILEKLLTAFFEFCDVLTLGSNLEEEN